MKKMLRGHQIKTTKILVALFVMFCITSCKSSNLFSKDFLNYVLSSGYKEAFTIHDDGSMNAIGLYSFGNNKKGFVIFEKENVTIFWQQSSEWDKYLELDELPDMQTIFNDSNVYVWLLEDNAICSVINGEEDYAVINASKLSPNLLEAKNTIIEFCKTVEFDASKYMK